MQNYFGPFYFGELRPYNSKYSSNFVLCLACSWYSRPLISRFCLACEIREIKGTLTLRVLQYTYIVSISVAACIYGYVRNNYCIRIVQVLQYISWNGHKLYPLLFVIKVRVTVALCAVWWPSRHGYCSHVLSVVKVTACGLQVVSATVASLQFWGVSDILPLVNGVFKPVKLQI